MAGNVNTRSCGKCGTCKIETTDLEDHVRFCVRYFPFFCYVCDTRCASEAAMALHFRFKHPGTKKRICEQREEEKELEVERIIKESQPSDQEREGFGPPRASTPTENSSSSTASGILYTSGSSNASAESFSIFRAPQASGGQSETLDVANLSTDTESEAESELSEDEAEATPETVWKKAMKNSQEELFQLRTKLHFTQLIISNEAALSTETFRGMNQKEKKANRDQFENKIQYLRDLVKDLKRDIAGKKKILYAMNCVNRWAASVEHKNFDLMLSVFSIEN